MASVAEAAGVILPDLDTSDWRDGADESAQSHSDSWYAYHLPGSLQLEIDVVQGYPEYAHIEERRDAETALHEWWSNCSDGQAADVPLAEWLVQWDYTDPVAMGLLAVAQPGAERVRIWREPHYYSGTCDAPSAGYDRVTLDDGQPTDEIWEGTYTEAQAYVEEYMSAPSGYDGIPARNVLSHGQASSDTLTIVVAED
jgi:hypothetical protein